MHANIMQNLALAGQAGKIVLVSLFDNCPDGSTFKMCKYQVILQIRTIMRTVVHYQMFIGAKLQLARHCNFQL